jgi:hypothetical protein
MVKKVTAKNKKVAKKVAKKVVPKSIAKKSQQESMQYTKKILAAAAALGITGAGVFALLKMMKKKEAEGGSPKGKVDSEPEEAEEAEEPEEAEEAVTPTIGFTKGINTDKILPEGTKRERKQRKSSMQNFNLKVKN